MSCVAPWNQHKITVQINKYPCEYVDFNIFKCRNNAYTLSWLFLVSAQRIHSTQGLLKKKSEEKTIVLLANGFFYYKNEIKNN